MGNEQCCGNSSTADLNKQEYNTENENGEKDTIAPIQMKYKIYRPSTEQSHLTISNPIDFCTERRSSKQADIDKIESKPTEEVHDDFEFDHENYQIDEESQFISEEMDIPSTPEPNIVEKINNSMIETLEEVDTNDIQQKPN